MFRNVVLLTLLLVFLHAHPSAAADARPNVIWIIADDLGPEVGCYGYPDVATPNIDRLAKNGRRYTRAFSTSPVCSASRSAFVTGRYQTSIHAHHHNTRDKRALPESVPPVTQLMRAAGYFVCNGRGIADDRKIAKSHFNFQYSAREFFDGTDWSQRRPDQPFFAMVQIKEPHRTFVKSDRLRTRAPIPPYYPEHPVTRADWSNYLASVEEADRRLGNILNRLQSENLLQKTLIIFFGDHGRPHVRGKQWLYDGGLHTPLILHWPAVIKPGVVQSGLVSLLDVMPTTLAAADVTEDGASKRPGLNLLAPDWRGHDLIFAARDRCGDAADRIRCVRTRDFKYIRNFFPERPYLQLSAYKKLQYPVLTLMKTLHARGQWDSLFMAQTRPPEELYDLKSDPHEMKNLAANPAYQQQLETLRAALDQWIEATGDTGAINEATTVDLDALMKSKKNWYEKTMRQRGLDPNISDRDYLNWWEKQLGVHQPED